MGTGLGLSVSKNLSEKLNYKLIYDSKYGKGTTFSLIIPILKKQNNMCSTLNKKNITEFFISTKSKFISTNVNFNSIDNLKILNLNSPKIFPENKIKNSLLLNPNEHFTNFRTKSMELPETLIENKSNDLNQINLLRKNVKNFEIRKKSKNNIKFNTGNYNFAVKSMLRNSSISMRPDLKKKSLIDFKINKRKINSKLNLSLDLSQVKLNKFIFLMILYFFKYIFNQMIRILIKKII